MASNSNRGVVYRKPGHVEVQKIDFPTFRNPAGKTIDHGIILKVVTTNICGSDQHMVRGRTTLHSPDPLRQARLLERSSRALTVEARTVLVSRAGSFAVSQSRAPCWSMRP